MDQEAPNKRSTSWTFGVPEIFIADNCGLVLFGVVDLRTRTVTAFECTGEDRSITTSTLDRLVRRYPKPCVIEIDEFMEFARDEITKWAAENQIPIDFIPSKRFTTVNRPHRGVE